jgi:hypothetical protein
VKEGKRRVKEGKRRVKEGKRRVKEGKRVSAEFWPVRPAKHPPARLSEKPVRMWNVGPVGGWVVRTK